MNGASIQTDRILFIFVCYRSRALSEAMLRSAPGVGVGLTSP